MSLRAAARALTWVAVLGLGATTTAAQNAAAPFTMPQPAFMSGPTVEKTLMGTTYAYAAESAGAELRLMITTMRAAEIRTRFGNMTDVQCINLFMDELKKSHERFFVVAMNRPLAVGPAEFLRFRWTGYKARKAITGVLSCGELAGDYYVVHFVDELKAATGSFPAIRASLKNLRPPSP